MTTVPFKVAKAIKDVGYPQLEAEGTKAYTETGRVIMKEEDIVAYPSYIEVWLWLERNTDLLVDTECIRSGDGKKHYRYFVEFPSGYTYPKYNLNYSSYCYESREDAIIAAIHYMVDNKLIK